MKNSKRLKIAAVQMVSEVGAIEENLARATMLVKVALAQGAEMVIFPELMSSGYTLSAKIWQGAEPTNGPTADWLRDIAGEYGIYVGTSFIEAAGGHFYNTFVLANPAGKEAGRVRKAHAETYFFRGAKGTRHVIETEIGKIGVGICGDNHYASLLPELQREQVDLMLMPHAWPSPCRVNGKISAADIERQEGMAKKIAVLYQQHLGVPVVFVNRVGAAALDKGPGLTAKFMNSENFHFAGLSTIVDSDGAVLAQMGGKEGAAVAEVILNSALKTAPTPPAFGKWVFPGSAARDILFGLDGAAGKVWYAINPKRRKIARRVAAG